MCLNQRFLESDQFGFSRFKIDAAHVSFSNILELTFNSERLDVTGLDSLNWLDLTKGDWIFTSLMFLKKLIRLTGKPFMKTTFRLAVTTQQKTYDSYETRDKLLVEGPPRTNAFICLVFRRTTIVWRRNADTRHAMAYSFCVSHLTITAGL